MLRKDTHGDLNCPKVIFLSALVFLFAAFNTANADTTVTVYNCSDSAHNIDVYIDNPSTSTGYYNPEIVPGSSQEFICSGSKCELKFEHHSHKKIKNTDQSPWYVHVKKNKNFSIRNTEENCG